jgi:hypothetical protein
MAKQKGLTVEDLMKSREAMDKEQLGEGVGMRNLAAAITPSLTPIAQSLGKLQQISEPNVTQNTINNVSKPSSDVNKGIVETSKTLQTLITLNRQMVRTIERTNTILTDQLNVLRASEKRQAKQDEESNEYLRRMGEGGVSTDIAAPAVVQADIDGGAAQEEATPGKSKPMSGMRRTGRTLAGAAIGGTVGGGLYAMSSDSIKDLLGKIGIGSGEATAIGAAIGAAIAADLPFKEMAAAAVSLTKDLIKLADVVGPLAIKYSPYLAAIGAAAYGLYKLDEYVRKIPGQEKQKAAATVNLPAALDPATANRAIEEAATSEEAEDINKRKQQQMATVKRMGGSAFDVFRAVELGGMLGGKTTSEYIREEEEMVEASRARGMGKIGKEISLPTTPQFITPYTEEISDERANEIFKGRPQIWKKWTPEQRSKALISAREKGVMDINPELTRATNTGFAAGDIKASESLLSLEEIKAQAVLSPRLGAFNVSSTEEGRNALPAAAPTIIRGGDTINNVTNVTGGSGGSSGGGSPSIYFDPWDPLKIGRPWRAYASSWGG